MNQINADQVSKNLVAKFGLPIKAIYYSSHSGEYIQIIPEEFGINEGFQIKIQIRWRSVNLELVFGKFAGDLLREMSQSNLEKRQTFSALVKQINSEKGEFLFKINDQVFDPYNIDAWPSTWKSLNIAFKTAPLEINSENQDLTIKLINKWVEIFFACIIALTPMEEIYSDFEVSGLPEGAVEKVEVNRYERSRFNRTLCINFHGTICKVCGIDLMRIYGEIAAGFIHIHHTTPISKLGRDYKINPIEELVPVCPNCHAMLHRKDPPYTITELKELMYKSTNTN